jgi:sulfate adenylyltransferase
MPSSVLIPPHGGNAIDLLVTQAQAAQLKQQSRDWPSWDLTERQLCDLELLANGGFSPLRGFLGRPDYERVRDEMRLADGTLWPIPVTLDVSDEIAAKLGPGETLALRDPEGVMLAVLHVSEVWQPDRELEAERVFGTTRRDHPGVDYPMSRSHGKYVGGRIEALQLPLHYDYQSLRLTPSDTRREFARLGWNRVVAFQTRNPMHRAHVEMTLRAAREAQANLLIHPVVGMTKPGDVDHYTRVRAYQAVLGHLPRSTAMLALLPLAMRMGGPREAVWHAIIRRNYGCTHLIVGRDHAGPGSGSAEPFYGPYDAQELLAKHANDVGVQMVPFKELVYVKERDAYLPVNEVPEGMKAMNVSGTELRDRLQDGREIPEWFTYPEVVRELRRTHPPRARQGFTVFFTGLSGSGKSTIGNALLVKLLQMGGRPVTFLDGDIVRKHLSSELGFSKEHRNLNISRIGFVAAEVTKSGGVALCAPIAPYDAVRKQVRSMIAPHGGFVLVHVSTPLEVCEQRDRKGLYAKARAGVVKEFTGISDPYEAPGDAELVIDTTSVSPDEASGLILAHLERLGYIGGSDSR